MNYEIVKNKPLPPIQRAGAGRRAKYPFADMDVNDAFMAGEATAALRNTLSSCADYYAKKHNPSAKFSVRTIDGMMWVGRVA